MPKLILWHEPKRGATKLAQWGVVPMNGEREKGIVAAAWCDRAYEIDAPEEDEDRPVTIRKLKP